MTLQIGVVVLLFDERRQAGRIGQRAQAGVVQMDLRFTCHEQQAHQVDAGEYTCNKTDDTCYSA